MGDDVPVGEGNGILVAVFVGITIVIGRNVDGIVADGRVNVESKVGVF